MPRSNFRLSYRAVVNNFSLCVADELHGSLPGDFRIDPSLPTPIMQRELSTRLEGVVVERFLQPDGGLSVRTRAHWRLTMRPGAGAWLRAIPSEALGPAFSASAFTMLQEPCKLTHTASLLYPPLPSPSRLTPV